MMAGLGRTLTDLRIPSVDVAEVMDGGFQVVDVRSPSEFAEGHLPGAINLPFLDDEQRAAVGAVYAEKGAARARLAAMELVSPLLPQYLSSLCEFARAQPRRRRLALMCWRGGERSRNVALLLALVGVHVVTVDGGYRAYRRKVVAGLADWEPSVPVITLHGKTGAGKSALLRALGQGTSGLRRPRPWALDLEGLALHRGSLLGDLNQPGGRRQKVFEALLWEELRRTRGEYLVLEGEGSRIGPINVPKTVAEAIRHGRPVLVTAPIEQRVARIVREYAPQNWDEVQCERFRRSLGLIGARLPRKTLHSLETAFDDGRFIDVVKGLLVNYYDPLYERSSTEGRDFVLEFTTSPDPTEDARRFVHDMARLIREGSF